MPRIARAVATGFPHHIVQRGNNRERVFSDKEDEERYLSLLKKYSAKWDSPLLAYCLMSNHIHILTRPKTDESLYKMMQGVTLCYTQYANGKYQRSGRLWESRYHSCIVDNREIFMGGGKIYRTKSGEGKDGKKSRGLHIFKWANSGDTILIY